MASHKRVSLIFWVLLLTPKSSSEFLTQTRAVYTCTHPARNGTHTHNLVETLCSIYTHVHRDGQWRLTILSQSPFLVPLHTLERSPSKTAWIGSTEPRRTTTHESSPQLTSRRDHGLFCGILSTLQSKRAMATPPNYHQTHSSLVLSTKLFSETVSTGTRKLHGWCNFLELLVGII